MVRYRSPGVREQGRKVSCSTATWRMASRWESRVCGSFVARIARLGRGWRRLGSKTGDDGDAVRLTHRGDGHFWGFSLVIGEELGRTDSANQMVGAWAAGSGKARVNVEVAVSGGDDPSTRVGVQHEAGRWVEVDAVFLKMLKDEAGELEAGHGVRGVETGVPVERNETALRHGGAGAGNQRYRLKRGSSFLGRLRGGADAGHEAEACAEGRGANRRGWSIDHCCSVLLAMCRFVLSGLSLVTDKRGAVGDHVEVHNEIAIRE
jgi:hypothetical protein